MTSFSDFWNSLNDNYQWVEWMERIARTEQKNLKRAAETAYGNYIAEADGNNDPFTKYSVQEQRKYVGNIMKNQKPEAFKPQLQQVEVKEQKPDPNYKILEGEERTKRIKEWQEAVLSVDNNFRVPHVSKKEAAEEGDWLPKKQAEYKPMDPNLFYLKEGVTKFSGRKYKGMLTFPGFRHFDFGMVSVFADSKESAEEILTKAGRYAKAKVAKIKAVLVNERLT